MNMTKPGKSLPPQLFPACMEWWLLGTSPFAQRWQMGRVLPILSPTDRNVACFPFTTCLKCIEMGQQQTSYSRPERDKKHFCLYTWEAQGRFGHCYWFSGGNTLQGIEPKRSSWWAKNGKGRLSNASTLVQGGVSTVATVWTTLGTWHWEG